MTIRVITPAIFSAVAFTAPTLADTFTVDTKIESATIYQANGASITRTGTVTLPSGKHTLILEGLHEDIIDNDIPPSILLSGNTRILSVKYADQSSAEAASEIQEDLKKKIDTKANEITDLNNKIQVHNLQLSLLGKLGSNSELPSDTDSLNQTMEYMANKAEALYNSIQSERILIAAKTKELNALKRELDRTGDSLTDFKKAILEVDVPAKQDVAISFLYALEDAAWDMQIEADLNTVTKQLSITQRASVSQETGESWENVSLTLSGSTPSYNLGDIRISPEFLTIGEKKERVQYNSPVMTRMQDAAFEEIIVAGVERKRTGYDHAFVLPTEINLNSDGTEESLILASKTLPVELVTAVAPFQSTIAYVFADTKIEGMESIRDINVIARRDGLFVGESGWPNLEEGKSVRLPYGADKNILVTYTEQAGKDGNKGFINKDNIVEKRYLITVTNNNTTATSLEVFDRYPVSAHEDITVKPLSDATKPTNSNIDGLQGVVSWEKTLAPGETWTITHAYRIEYPDDKILNRRNGS